jgi:mRNA-degrading endonuclease toxin of MazEF toxin-antitoxin module
LVNIGQIFFLSKKLQNENMRHPYVLIKKCYQKDKNNGLNFLACMITSNAKKATWPYTIPLNPDEGGMIRQSYILCFNKAIIYENELEKYVGEISESRLQEVIMVSQNYDKSATDLHPEKLF